MAAEDILLSRCRGSMVGAVVGDCIGAKFKDQWLPYVSWEAISGVLGELMTAASETFTFTGGTAMARSVAQSLIDNDGAFVAKDMAERFSKQYSLEPRRGYGAGVTTVFRKLENSQYTNVYRPATEQFNGSGSYGNGGAMRISPLGLFTHLNKDYEIPKYLCGKITRLTHTHNQAIQGALLQLSAVRLALKSSQETTADQFIDQLITTFEPHDNDNEYTNLLVKMKEVLLTDKSDSQEIVELFGHGVSALTSVPTALFCYLRSKRPIPSIPVQKPFERAILYAISMGGDTDTIASMTGAMAGACYGEEVIPTKWQTACEGLNHAREQAEQLYKLL